MARRKIKMKRGVGFHVQFNEDSPFLCETNFCNDGCMLVFLVEV